MKSTDLKTWQATRIKERLGPTLSYLGRLVRRMDKRQVLPDDPLYVAALRVYNELQHLCVQLHYLSCPSGVGLPERE